MAEESPLVKLVDTILVGAAERGAQAIRIRAGKGDECAIDFLVDGTMYEYMRPPMRLLAPIVRRLSILASLPIYPRGGSASGFLQVRIGEYRAVYFAILVFGHGDAMAAVLREITEDEYHGAQGSGPTGVYR